VVVNCAGRTRSIIGAQSLINAGLPNKVMALKNGTMGWHLAGLKVARGETKSFGPQGPEAAKFAQGAASTIAQRMGIKKIDMAGLKALEAKGDPLYKLDVRDPSEYAQGHIKGFRHAAGGQLVQATDQYAGTLKSRIVCVDDKEVRAVMTASWLRQMGWQDVFVLVAAGDEKGVPATPVLGEAPRGAAIDAAALSDLLARNGATVIDLSLSRDYASAHIPGAWFAIRSRLALAFPKIPLRGTLVLTSEDGVLAGLAVEEARGLASLPVRYLSGGNAAWRAAGFPLTAEDPRMADEPVDAWLKPYERPDGVRQAMADYLAWETDLLPRIARDGCARFTSIPKS
jgi:rhodanese-related sulfurtransferase